MNERPPHKADRKNGPAIAGSFLFNPYSSLPQNLRRRHGNAGRLPFYLAKLCRPCRPLSIPCGGRCRLPVCRPLAALGGRCLALPMPAACRPRGGPSNPIAAHEPPAACRRPLALPCLAGRCRPFGDRNPLPPAGPGRRRPFRAACRPVRLPWPRPPPASFMSVL
jgi:hypothetical protein